MLWDVQLVLEVGLVHEIVAEQRIPQVRSWAPRLAVQICDPGARILLLVAVRVSARGG